MDEEKNRRLFEELDMDDNGALDEARRPDPIPSPEASLAEVELRHLLQYCIESFAPNQNRLTGTEVERQANPNPNPNWRWNDRRCGCAGR